MKENEISLVIIENLKLDKNELKILDYKEFYMIQLVSY